MQAELDSGESIKALRRFNQLLRDVPADSWGASLALPPVHHYKAQAGCAICCTPALQLVRCVYMCVCVKPLKKLRCAAAGSQSPSMP